MSTTNQWMYARGQQQFGPVTSDQLKQLMRTGQVQGADLVWTDGMPQWAPAQSIAELHETAPAGTDAVAPVAPVASIAVPYYTAVGGLPQRAQERLKKHAHPTGDRDDWPLDDARVAQFAATARLRKRITGAAGLYNLLLALQAIGLAIVLVITLLVPRRGGMTSSDWIAMSSMLFFGIGFAVLFFFAARSTSRAQRWAPLTMFILFLLGAAFYLLLFGIGVVASSSSEATGIMIGTMFGLLFLTAFTVVSWRAFAAIPQYLAQPAWCQELVIASEAKK